MENPALWDDPENAQKVSKEKKRLDDTVGLFKKLTSSVNDAAELFELSMAEEDYPSVEVVGEEVFELEKSVEKLEFQRMFNQPMDPANCYLEIQSGAGGTEAQDWASMLERMYLHYAERKGFTVELQEETEGEVAGIKGCTIYIQGDYAYGMLRTETGVHRLVRKSPFDANARRHTSFASVYVYPEIDDSFEVEINPADLRIDVFRAGRVVVVDGAQGCQEIQVQFVFFLQRQLFAFFVQRFRVIESFVLERLGVGLGKRPGPLYQFVHRGLNLFLGDIVELCRVKTDHVFFDGFRRVFGLQKGFGHRFYLLRLFRG